MNWMSWATIGTSAIGVAITFVATIIKMTWWLGAKLDEITTKQVLMLNEHEHRDQERHVENIERFAKLETAILKNGHSKRRR